MATSQTYQLVFTDVGGRAPFIDPIHCERPWLAFASRCLFRANHGQRPIKAHIQQHQSVLSFAEIFPKRSSVVALQEILEQAAVKRITQAVFLQKEPNCTFAITAQVFGERPSERRLDETRLVPWEDRLEPNRVPDQGLDKVR